MVTSDRGGGPEVMLLHVMGQISVWECSNLLESTVVKITYCRIMVLLNDLQRIVMTLGHTPPV